jgi:hypothetical protein
VTFTLAVASGITNAQGASFILDSTLTRPFTRERPEHENGGFIISGQIALFDGSQQREAERMAARFATDYCCLQICPRPSGGGLCPEAYVEKLLGQKYQ